MNEQLFSKKYQVKREIACGGMGTIYLATDIKLGRDVAIKMLHPQYSREIAFAQRFLREARSMAKLDHPNIIRIWSVEEEEENHFIVMEYSPGRDLKQIIRERGPLPIPEALSLIIQIVQGLAYAHYMGIIHRDIKPGNILVDQEGKVKITDFGIAAALNESSLTMDGTVIGTPEYMAPEQARAESVGPHTDMYAVGILLYELLTGQTPYKGIPAQSLVAKLAFEEKNPSLTFPPHIPAELQALITKMTQKRVEDRLTDITEILSVLKKEFPSSSAEIQDEDKTEVYSPIDPSESSAGPSEKSFVQDQSIAPQDKTDKRADIPSDLPPLHEDSASPNESHPLIPPLTRKLLMSAIGILAFVGIIVLVVSQWQTKEPPLLPPDEIVTPSDHQDEVETALGNIQQISQNGQATQEKINREFESFSLAIDALHRKITKKKIPSNRSDAQQWLNKTKKDVATLVQDRQKLENSQKALMDKSMEDFSASIHQGEQLLQQDLSGNQQTQLREALTNLENVKLTLESTLTNHLQNTQNLLSKLETELKKTERIVASIQPPKGKKPPKPSPKTATQVAALHNEIRSLDKEIGDLLKTLETTALNFTSQLSNLQAGIKQIDPSSDPNSTQKLAGFKDNVRTIQRKAQTVFSQEKSQQQLEKSLQTTAHKYQVLSKEVLDSSQKAQLGKLNEILKNSQNRLKTFPTDRWKQFQALLLDSQALLSKTEKAIDQHTLDQKTKEEQLADLAQKTTHLATGIQEFHSQSSSQYSRFTQQVTTTRTQIDSLQSLPPTETLEDTVAKLQDSLGKLQETITQHSGRHAQQSQILAQRQAELRARLKKLTQSPLPSPLEQQASHVRQTFQSNQKELEDLNQLDWKKLEAKIETTLLTLKKIIETIKDAIPKTPEPPVEPPNDIEALKKILKDFTTAYENRDLLHLKLTTTMSESRTRNLHLMFKNYMTIETHTEIVSTSESQAKVKIFVDKLINKEGENITPNPIIRETTITIPKKDGKWGKIQW